MKTLYSGFLCYGAGNIGDDLTFGGFLESLKALSCREDYAIKALSFYDIQSQRQRFSDVSWSRPNMKFPLLYPGGSEDLKATWIGVGLTPVQITCGDYFLKYFLQSKEGIQKFEQKVLVNIGAEAELEFEPEKERYAAVLAIFDRISVRDPFTCNLLKEKFHVPSEKIFTGSDLASVFLAHITADFSEEKKYDYGYMVTGDTLQQRDIENFGKFLRRHGKKSVCLANDVRDIQSVEQGVYKKVTAFPRLLTKIKTPFLKPAYTAALDCRELLLPTAQCRSLISSRYHGVLAGAWLGLKVAAIARSSKVKALACELDIPYIEPPLTVEKLVELKEKVAVVSLQKLEQMKEKALQGVRFALNL